MYFCYVDESGDPGMHDEHNPGKTGSKYFILSALIIDADKWKAGLDMIKSYRKQLAAQAYLNYDVEFHCAEMIDPRKTTAYNQMSISERWDTIRQFAERIGKQVSCSIIGVVIDKTSSKLDPRDYFTSAITNLYLAYDEFLKEQKSYGIVLFDRANEKVATTHVRKLMGTGATGQNIPGIRIGWVIEDPFYRNSSDSFFIQATDMIAYTLKEQEFPLTARKKYNADKIFKNMLSDMCFKSSNASADRIIRP
ncbi:MAG TPA: DUF3800 domain-containing protein [Cytophaga sp.]|nr:DUF3800 domain-containing protein [Cytophaga sp.]